MSDSRRQPVRRSRCSPLSISSLCALCSLLLAALALAGCGSKAPSMEMHEVPGLDGLALSIPKGYAAKPERDTLRVFVPERERSRSRVQIFVSVAERRPAWTGMEEKEVGGRVVHYVVVEGEGGSGGTTLELKAWVAAEGRFFVLDSTVQPESGGDSEFRAEWAILPTLRWGGTRGL